MPVQFEGKSEYDANYKWLDSVKSASCKLTPGQVAPRAGLVSAKQGMPVSAKLGVEPPIQRRKKPIPIDTTETTKFVRDLDDTDSYILLGDQSKFGPSVKYRTSKHFSKSPSRKTYKVLKHDHSPPLEPAVPNRPPSPPPKPSSESLGYQPPVTKPHSQPVRSRSEQTKSSPPKERQMSPSPEKPRAAKSPKRTRSPSPKAAEDQKRLNTSVQAKMNKVSTYSHPQASADYALKYRSGVAPKHPAGIIRVSEYKKAFEWKESVRASPLLAAEQVIHKSDSVLGPYKASVPRKTEYEAEFMKFAPRLVEAKVSPKKDDEKAANPVTRQQATEEDKKTLKNAANPQKAFFPHGKHRRTKSEYASNFQAPAVYSYSDGAWKGVNPAHIHPQKEMMDTVADDTNNSWFQEVMELRRRAEEYRKRARGTHFSHFHLAQLMAKGADLWDTATESSRTVTAMSLETASQVSGNKVEQKVEAPKKAHLQDVNRKLAWTAAKQKRDQSPPSVSEQASVASASRHSINGGSPEAPVSDLDTLVSEEIGRIPTPRLRQEIGSARRHHLDITTPSVGGALLVSPPPGARQQNGDSNETSFREEPTKHSSSKIQLEPEDQSISDDDPDEVTPRLPPRRAIPKQRNIASQTRVIQPRKTVSAPEPIHESICSCGADDEPAAVQAKKSFKKTRQVSLNRLSSPIFGKPTIDDCSLVDEEALTDRPLETEFVKSKQIQPAKTKQNQQTRASRMSTIKEGFGETYHRQGSTKKCEAWDMFGNKPGMMLREEDDDDALSTSMRSIASSCSLASETLERASRNRDEFWGKTKRATVG